MALAVTGCTSGSAAAPRTPSELFATACARCHGAEGRGGVPSRPGAPAPRDFTDAAWHAGKTDRELARLIARGNGEMPGFSNTLTADQIDGLVGFVRTLRSGGAPAAGATAPAGGGTAERE